MKKLFAPPTVLLAIVTGFLVGIFPEVVIAQVYQGPGIVGGIDQAQAILGISNGDLRLTILALLRLVLSYMGLVAVIVIVIAGIMLVVSGGEESTKDKAKKIIFYTIIGLIIILFASAIVWLITSIIK
ncbi:hypothetical protein HOL63_04450 [Candidatus Peregrinibacteria bacterium]|jgi:hypothetical protein|nr:hypothetical protein [Candidatus Peregrinibacteria bacterium]MBT5468565.1 hypothetical protein [Candidatus Peregrinibacteria bacterium]